LCMPRSKMGSACSSRRARAWHRRGDYAQITRVAAMTGRNWLASYSWRSRSKVAGWEKKLAAAATRFLVFVVARIGLCCSMLLGVRGVLDKLDAALATDAALKR
jgi:hypothetical protein